VRTNGSVAPSRMVLAWSGVKSCGSPVPAAAARPLMVPCAMFANFAFVTLSLASAVDMFCVYVAILGDRDVYVDGVINTRVNVLDQWLCDPIDYRQDIEQA